MEKHIRLSIGTMIVMFLCLLSSQDCFAQSDYFAKRATEYTREAEYYQKKADSYRREAQYYLKKAESYEREAAYYTKKLLMRQMTQTQMLTEELSQRK